MSKYDFFIAGRWRNKETVKQVLDAVRESGKTAYCFIENDYRGEKVELEFDGDIEAKMQSLESLPLSDPLIRKIFEMDMDAQRQSENFLVVLPVGIAGHMEAGVSYGMGKKCYAVGVPEKTETLYRVFDQIFPNLDELKTWLSK